MSELGGNKHLIRIENPRLIYFSKTRAFVFITLLHCDIPHHSCYGHLNEPWNCIAHTCVHVCMPVSFVWTN